MRNPLPEAVSQGPSAAQQGWGTPCKPHPVELTYLTAWQTFPESKWLRAVRGGVLADTEIMFWFDARHLPAINYTFDWDWPISASHRSRSLTASADRWTHSLIWSTQKADMAMMRKKRHLDWWRWNREGTESNINFRLGRRARQVPKFSVWIQGLPFTGCSNLVKCLNLSVPQFSHL